MDTLTTYMLSNSKLMYNESLTMESLIAIRKQGETFFINFLKKRVRVDRIRECTQFFEMSCNSSWARKDGNKDRRINKNDAISIILVLVNLTINPRHYAEMQQINCLVEMESFERRNAILFLTRYLVREKQIEHFIDDSEPTKELISNLYSLVRGEDLPLEF